MNKIVTVVTHDGTFHADDAMAIAICDLIFGSSMKLIRTRDPDIINSADYVFDVGDVYDPEKKRFDHHMNDGPVRSNDYPYSSAGLAWAEFGKQIIKRTNRQQFHNYQLVQIFNKVDRDILIPIDLADNGLIDNENVFTISNIISNMNPQWDDTINNESMCFYNAMLLCKQILLNNIRYSVSELNSVEKIKYIITNDPNSLLINDQVLILPCKMPFNKAIYQLGLTNVKFVIFKGYKDEYLINTVSDSKTLRQYFPEKWSGLINDEFETISGVKGSKFCHKNLFIAGSYSLKSAIELVKIMLL